MVVVEIWRKRTRRRRRRRKEGKEGRNEGDGADIKSNNPHLTGGELHGMTSIAWGTSMFVGQVFSWTKPCTRKRCAGRLELPRDPLRDAVPSSASETEAKSHGWPGWPSFDLRVICVIYQTAGLKMASAGDIDVQICIEIWSTWV